MRALVGDFCRRVRRCAVRAGSAALVLLIAATTAWTGASEDPPGKDEPVAFSDEERRLLLLHSPLPELPNDETNAVADNPAAVRLGHFLFFDKRLSGNGQVSCATCHDAAKGLADGRSVGEGIARGTRNTPSLWNVAYHRWYFWDGRADSLWSQALHPIERADEMGGSRLAVARLIAGDAELRPAYEAIFGKAPDPATLANEALEDTLRGAVDRLFANVGKAIAAYERKLVSRAAPFDRFVAGLRERDAEKLRAISPAAQRGAKLFVGRGNCRTCHTGPHFSDLEFHSVMVPDAGGLLRDAGRFEGIRTLQSDPFNAAGEFSDDRAGSKAAMLRFLTNRSDNAGRFRTPTLRNVALTAPYMHGGQYATLADVLEHYSTFADAPAAGHIHRETILLPLNLTEQEAADLQAFLAALTDTNLDPQLLRAPAGPR